MTLHTTRTVLSLALAAAVTGGCADKSLSPVLVNDRFQSDDAERPVDKIFDQQKANADREDGTFYAQHFTDGKLNGLGYQKLSSMGYGASAGKLAVYLDLPKTADYSACQDSLAKALARGGMSDEHYTITAGANPNVSGTAAEGLNGLAKQDASEGTGGPGPIAAGGAFGSGPGTAK